MSDIKEGQLAQLLTERLHHHERIRELEGKVEYQDDKLVGLEAELESLQSSLSNIILRFDPGSGEAGEEAERFAAHLRLALTEARRAKRQAVGTSDEV